MHCRRLGAAASRLACSIPDRFAAAAPAAWGDVGDDAPRRQRSPHRYLNQIQAVRSLSPRPAKFPYPIARSAAFSTAGHASPDTSRQSLRLTIISTNDNDPARKVDGERPKTKRSIRSAKCTPRCVLAGCRRQKIRRVTACNTPSASP
jgi:hypothetical protein